MRRPLLLLALMLVLAGGVMVAAMLRTSTTFDEIVMVAGGARGYETGEWSMVPEHPPLVQYVYGLIPWLDGLTYPDETGVTDELRAHMGYRYRYAQFLYWRSGNDPERLALLGRIPAVLCALALALLVFAFTRRAAGDGAALLAAFLTLSLPDVLAHGGIAYNDVPMALAMFAAAWAIDAAIRAPDIRRGLIAGALIALSLGVKNSAVALGPVAVLILLWEGILRRRDRDWLRAIGPAALATMAATYLTLVLVYRGDFLLTEYRYALGFAFGHVTRLLVPAYLLGEAQGGGWWYWFPVVFLFKTSAGLHLLMLLALVHWATTFSASALVHTRLRAPLVVAFVFAGLLMSSDLNIGFRHALPVLPPLIVLTAAGIARAWAAGPRMLRVVTALALLLISISTARVYPWFISYVSEYGPPRDQIHRALSDSSVDWGQGLLALREFMRENDIPSVYLSYFGSALPEGYGIRYATLDSFFELEPQPPLPEPPRWIAVSATSLTGTYVGNELLAQLREQPPAHVVGGSIYLYPLGD